MSTKKKPYLSDLFRQSEIDEHLRLLKSCDQAIGDLLVCSIVCDSDALLLKINRFKRWLNDELKAAEHEVNEREQN